MRRTAVLIACGLALAACSDVPIRPVTASFDWLAGCWRAERKAGVYEEMWLPPGPDGSVGAAREVRGARTVSYDFMRIELREGGLVYVAQPAGQLPTEFRMVEHEPGRLAFENPEHDFPTRIEYRFVDLDALTARISGTRGGATRTVDFALRRIACEG